MNGTSFGFVTGMWLLGVVLVFPGCSDNHARSADLPQRQVYVDVETGQPVVAPRTTDLPAVNPATGRRTLMPGLYCKKCQRWYPAPPAEVVQRNPAARRCPRHGTLLTGRGPLPEK